MFARRTSLYIEFLAEIEKPQPNFTRLYSMWVRRNSYEILGVGGACTLQQLEGLQRIYPEQVKNALNNAKLPPHYLNEASSVARLLDTALDGMINSKTAGDLSYANLSPFFK